MSGEKVPVGRLVRDPDNIREDVGDIGGLADSMRLHGVLVPLLVAPIDDQLFLVVDGNRRLAAARRAKLAEVPVTVTAMPPQARKVVLQLVTNCQRVDLGPVERAEAMGRLRKSGMSNAAIARATGLSDATVSYHLRLLRLDVAVLEKIRAGVLTAAAGHEAVTLTQPGREPVTSKPSAARAMPSRRPRTPAKPRPSYFGGGHPLAAAVQARCRAAGHPAVSRYGRVGCGPCWEAEIRSDAAGAGGRPLGGAGAAGRVPAVFRPAAV